MWPPRVIGAHRHPGLAEIRDPFPSRCRWSCSHTGAPENFVSARRQRGILTRPAYGMGNSEDRYRRVYRVVASSVWACLGILFSPPEATFPPRFPANPAQSTDVSRIPPQGSIAEFARFRALPTNGFISRNARVTAPQGKRRCCWTGRNFPSLRASRDACNANAQR